MLVKFLNVLLILSRGLETRTEFKAHDIEEEDHPLVDGLVVGDEVVWNLNLRTY